jgi:MFS family permease
MPDNRWWLVIAAALAVFMVALDSSIVTVALPSIGGHFRTPAAVTEWVIIGYMLPMVALVLPVGRWLDSTGRRPAFVLAVAGFALASAAAGAAPGMAWLVSARVVQGAFGAMLMALVPALVAEAVRSGAQGRAMSLVATVGPLGAVSGPAVGGALVATLGWPAIFFVNVPVSLAVIAVGVRTIAPGGGLRLPDRGWAVESALLAAAATAVLGALTLAPSRGVAWLLVALLALPLVAVWASLPASRPVADLVRSPGMTAPVLALLFNVAGIAGAQFIAPFYLQQALHAGTALTGLVILAQPLAMATASPFGGYIADRWGGGKTALVGTLVLAGGLLLVVPLGTDWRPLDLAWRLALVGIGTGLFAGPNQAVAMQQAPRHLLATTGAATGLARSFAFALGPALATIPWAFAGYTTGGMRVAAAVAAGAAGLGAAVSIVGRTRRGAASPELETEIEDAA